MLDFEQLHLYSPITSDENLEELFDQALRALVKKQPIPTVEARFYPYAGLSSTIRLRQGRVFARVSDASKVALAYLVAFLRSHGVRMLDCQQETGHLASLGAYPIARRVFLDHLRQAIREPEITQWEVVAPLTT